VNFALRSAYLRRHVQCGTCLLLLENRLNEKGKCILLHFYCTVA
jgi:hypothetical protein